MGTDLKLSLEEVNILTQIFAKYFSTQFFNERELELVHRIQGHENECAGFNDGELK